MIRDLKDSESKLTDILDQINAVEGPNLLENQVTKKNVCVYLSSIQN